MIIARDAARRPHRADAGERVRGFPIRLELLLSAIAAAAGIVAWAVFFRAGLVLSHYDAKAHLVVARRVFDNITPGWQQFGAVWLPLPHLINALPVQVDLFYRTGAFASFVSIACFALTAWASARLVLRSTGSRAGAVTATALLALNPNLLYLQSTPMTEPLLLAVTSLCVLWLSEWVERDADRVPRRLACALVAAAWTRYEGWLVLAAALVAVAYVLWRRRVELPRLAVRMARVASWPAVAVLLFVVDSRVTVGAWFVAGGFYEVDPTYAGLAWKSLVSIWWGTHQLSGYTIESAALVAAGVVAWRALTRRQDATLLIVLSLFASAPLPMYAFYEGHPFRIRYMIPLVAACAVLAGIGVGLLADRSRAATSGRSRMRSRLPALAAAALIAALVLESPPWDRQAPMLLEAQWDVPASRERTVVTACLAPAYRGEKVMASMASLAHYMQELSAAGFAIADFVHEGTGSIWNLALVTGPAPHAGWMLVEEASEGGDVLARRIAADPSFARGMRRVCDGGGVALYQRVE